MKHLYKSSLLIIFVCFCLLACDDENCINGEGAIETRIMELSELDKISLYGVDHVTIKQGDNQVVKVTGYPNIIDELNTNISNKEWEIKLKDGCYNNADMDIEITIPSLKAANLIGSGKIRINDFDNQENQLFAISGSGSISIGGNTGTKDLKFSISGSGNIDVSENFSDLESVKLTITGSGDFDAFSLESMNYEINLSGSGSANVFAKKELNGTISGSGNINYKGNPAINVNVSGSGKVKNRN